MKAFSKNVRISPKKATLIAGMVQRMNAKEALTQLKFTPKKGAKVLYKLISSAVANAKNNFQQDENKLVIKTIRVTKGITYKRGLPVSRGRYHRIFKRNSNIFVEVGLDAATPARTESAEGAKEEKAPKAEKPTKKTAPKKESAKKAEKPARKSSKSEGGKAAPKTEETTN